MIRFSNSKKRVHTLTTALLLIGLAILSIIDKWWPGIMLVIGIPTAIRQYFLGEKYDAGISLLVFGGIFITASFDISSKVLLPVLFSLGAVYILLREFTKLNSGK